MRHMFVDALNFFRREQKVVDNKVSKVEELSYMTVPKRIELVLASGLTSSYKKKYRPKQRWDIEVFKEGALVTPDMFQALVKLDEIVRLNKGNLYIIDLYRSWKTQADAREKYLSGKKKAFVAKSGGSFHGAGCAVDILVKELCFEGLDRDEWLQHLWDLAKPLGFRPIISLPDLDASESWHFDHVNKDWQEAYEKLPYGEIAKACILDVGCWNLEENKEKIRKMFIQSQCVRLGYYEVGKIDGILGPKTKKILEFLGVGNFDTLTAGIALSKRDKNK